MNDVEQRFDRIDLQSLNHGCFASVNLGYDETPYLSVARFNGDRQGAANSTQPAVEREFTNEQSVGDLLLVESPVRSQNAERHGKVKTGAFFTNIGGRQVDCYVGGGNIVATIFQSCADAVATLAHRSVRQADCVEIVFFRFYVGNIHFHVDNAGVDAVNSGTNGLVKHRDTGGHTEG